MFRNEHKTYSEIRLPGNKSGANIKNSFLTDYLLRCAFLIDGRLRCLSFKKAGEYFSELPPKNVRVDTLIRSVFNASLRFWGSDTDFAILMGYIDTRGKLTLFGGDREKQTVTLTDKDKLVVFTNH